MRWKVDLNFFPLRIVELFFEAAFFEKMKSSNKLSTASGDLLNKHCVTGFAFAE